MGAMMKMRKYDYDVLRELARGSTSTPCELAARAPYMGSSSKIYDALDRLETMGVVGHYESGAVQVYFENDRGRKLVQQAWDGITHVRAGK